MPTLPPGLPDTLLDTLVADLEPVRPHTSHRAVLGLVALTVAGIATVAATLGIRPDILAGEPNMMVLLRGALLLMLGGICAASTLAMARPVVGRHDRSWAGAVAMASMVPATALLFALFDPQAAARAVWWSSAITCLAVSLTAAVGFAAILVAHLRRGAPVQLTRAAWVTGIAAGSLGVLVYSVHCPSNHIAYVGLWYTLAITLSAVAARLTVPRLIRW
jgi:hypothetical protein